MGGRTVCEERKRISVVERLRSGELTCIVVPISKVVRALHSSQVHGLVEGCRGLVLRMACPT
jgi:hypothetical protein